MKNKNYTRFSKISVIPFLDSFEKNWVYYSSENLQELILLHTKKVIAVSIILVFQ